MWKVPDRASLKKQSSSASNCGSNLAYRSFQRMLRRTLDIEKVNKTSASGVPAPIPLLYCMRPEVPFITKKELEARLEMTEIRCCGTPADTNAQESLTVCKNSKKQLRRKLKRLEYVEDKAVRAFIRKDQSSDYRSKGRPDINEKE